MGTSTLPLYLITVLVWGSTWIAIKFQLGDVPPLASVIYRFVLAAALLFAWCGLRSIPLRLTLREHGLLLIQGSCLFGFNYWLVYLASQYLISGIVAVVFSSIVFFNVINARILLGSAVSLKVLMGSVIGIIGVGLLFVRDLSALTLSSNTGLGLLLAGGATYVASLGNVVASHTASHGHSVMTINAWGMLYGTLVLIIVAWVLDVDYVIDTRIEYLASLIYLSVFGTIITFAAYLKLLSRIGPDKAGYVGMMVPVVALLISTVFEGYRWTLPSVVGVSLILLGNWQVLRK